MNTPFFSVIVPIHNKKEFILRGLESLASQKFQDYEIIIVDDGSTDGSENLCDNFVKFKKHIRIIHQKNFGSGHARNIGIENSKGKYLLFFDIDDLVGKDWLDCVYENLIGSSPEILIFGYREINLKYKTSITCSFENIEFISNDEIGKGFAKYIAGIKFNNGFVWNKAYKRSFIIKNDIKFPNINIQQDELFNHQVYRVASHVKLIDKPLYNYYVYENGNVRSKHIPDRIEIFKQVKHSFESLAYFWDLNENKELVKYINRRFLTNVFFNKEKNQTLTSRRDYFLQCIHDMEVNDTIERYLNEDSNIEGILALYCKLSHRKYLYLLLFIDKILSIARKLKQQLIIRHIEK